MKIERRLELPLPAELTEQFPYRHDWRHLPIMELTPGERLLAHLERLQGVFLDEEAAREIQLACDLQHCR